MKLRAHWNSCSSEIGLQSMMFDVVSLRMRVAPYDRGLMDRASTTSNKPSYAHQYQPSHSVVKQPPPISASLYHFLLTLSWCLRFDRLMSLMWPGTKAWGINSQGRGLSQSIRGCAGGRNQWTVDLAPGYTSHEYYP